MSGDPDSLPSPEDIDRASREAARRLTRSGQPRQEKSRRLRRSATYSDSRDPAPLSRVMQQFITEQGWQQEAAVAALWDNWSDVVGPELADHVRPDSFEDGHLVLLAESTAWATQVRLLLATVQQAVDSRVGRGVVTRMSVRGPQAPSWTAGPRRVKGRGPRDTYG